MSTLRERTLHQLQALVAQFDELDRKSLTADESEATARSWVERLLGVFGWDASDPRQVRQEYTIRGREVVRLQREGTTHRRPDYALLVAGERVLYLDAKRFDVAIADKASVAFQVRSYGWSAGFRVSYACDFEELAIWDCRHKPKQGDAPRVALVKKLHYTEYVREFDLLWQYLAREAIVGGSLQRLHPDDERPRGAEPLDADFEAQLSTWRVDLASAILEAGGTRDADLISAAAQRILDRIVFLRFCEELGLEDFGHLGRLLDDSGGFWPAFTEEHRRYRALYDGLLFPVREDDDPTGVERELRTWRLDGRVFERIVRGLYFPNPYRFDVIPLELLGGIYERFLGKRLRVVGDQVHDEWKPEHQRTQGAVYTPPWVVRRVVQRTLSPLTQDRAPGELLALRVLDPACGSAGFLLGVYDHLEDAILSWAHKNPRSDETRAYVVNDVDGPRLTRDCSRRIIDGCIFGVDIDPNAVEVARMSLALRHLERSARDLGDRPKQVLSGIGRNVRHGNSLVGQDATSLGFDGDAIRRLMPFAWSDRLFGFGNVMAEGGFHAVVGNPPYIEVKRYKEWMPDVFEYLKRSSAYETVERGKTDIAMPFMEAGARLLRTGGRLGFITQNRFFKTEYGASSRRWLVRERLLESVEDFRDLQVFPGRTTYTAVLTLQKGSEEVEYTAYDSLAAARARIPGVTSRLRGRELGHGPWSLDEPDLLRLHAELAQKHGTIGDFEELTISVGTQTLYGKIYQIIPTEVSARTVRGTNGLGADVVIERKAARPLCRNRGFFPFRRHNDDAWIVFPYDVEDDEVSEVKWPAFKARYPKAAAYLEQNRAALRSAVETEPGRDRWHLYTRPQNLAQQARPKVLFPMTIEDTVASVDARGDVYQDNVNVNSLRVTDDSVPLAAIAAVFNSTLFSALARLKAGLNDAGWRKFNRQFAELVPFPLHALRQESLTAPLSQLAKSIEAQQEELRLARAEGERSGLRASLHALWTELDEAVNRLYGLTAGQKDVLARYPRRVDRVELALRSTRAPGGEG